jgi:hypothetical protein
VIEHPGLFLSQDDNPPRPVGKPLEHLVAPSRKRPGGPDVRPLSFRMVARLPGPCCARFVVHEIFPGRRAFIPSNPVKRETVPRYAASERQAEMSLTSRSGGHRAGFRLAGSRDQRREKRGNDNGAMARMRY